MVSIIIPVYNAEKTIERCIGSILKQTYSNIEIIAIDDGSVDNSYEILMKLQACDSRIIVHRQENKGVSCTRNLGIELAKGDYIQFVDSDDEIDVSMTQKLVAELEEKQLDLEMCLFEYNESSNKSIKGFTYKESEMFYGHFRELMDNVLFQGPCNKLYRSSILKENNIKFPEEISKLEDSIFNARYIRYCKGVGLLSDKLYHYNYVDGSLSHCIHPDEIDAMITFYQAMDFALNCLNEENNNKYRDIVFCYAINQMEIIYRISWMHMKNNKNYKEIWRKYTDDMVNRNGFDMLAPYAKKSGIKLFIFFYILKSKSFNILLLYFFMIETIKKLVRKK